MIDSTRANPDDADRPCKRRFIMVWRPWLGPVLIGLARRLFDDGWSGRLYVTRSEFILGLSQYGDVSRFDAVLPFQVMYDSAMATDVSADEAIAAAGRVEARLGMTIGQLIVPDRHLGRGFSLAGAGFPRSGASNADWAQTCHAISSQVDFWSSQLDEFQPDLVLEAEFLLDIIARSRGVPVRVLTASRHGAYFYFSDDVLMRTERIRAAYDALTIDSSSPQLEVEQAASMVTYWRTAIKETSWSVPARDTLARTARALWGKMKGRKNQAGYHTLSEVAYMWRRTKQLRQMSGPKCVDLDTLKGKRFVYYPLATEPETALHLLSPEYFFQLETISSLCRDLPADVMLVVKEHHPACGARNRDFYESLFEFKNLVCVDVRVPSLELIEMAAATVTIAGSAGFESAAKGKPTIILGQHNIYGFLPHVLFVSGSRDLKCALDRCLAPDQDKEKPIRDGSRFLQAMMNVSFELRGFDAFDRTKVVEVGALDEAYSNLVSTLVSVSCGVKGEV